MGNAGFIAKPGIYGLKEGNPCGSIPGKKRTKKKVKLTKKVTPTKKGGPEEFKAGFSGRKIRSGGKGRGLGRGKGRGPRGIPFGTK